MGKKRQKVQWFPVDGLQWTGENEKEYQAESTDVGGPAPSNGVKEVKGGKEKGGSGSRRTSGQGWSSAVAPRFERRVIPVETGETGAGAGDTKHVYYDGELCEAETLPNGFTKIRSKNLDILFKREYYEQRIATQKQLSEDLNKTASKTTEKDSADCTPATATNDTEILSEKDMVTNNTESDTASLDKIDPDEIREFKPMNHGLETPAPDMESGQTSPFHGGYPTHYPHNCEAPEMSPESYMSPTGGRANLYLYSPSNNTLIPCEEIIIPNPVMSPETGEAVYPAPANIYLAYPVQGPDGRSYITQTFPMVEGGYIPGYGGHGYSHSVSYDSSNYYSSTPHTPNSGEESGSGSSTQPTSPPPLVNYHPSNWFKPDHTAENGHGGSMPEYPGVEYHYIQPSHVTTHNSIQQTVVTSSSNKSAGASSSSSVPANTTAPTEKTVINGCDNPSRLNGSGSVTPAGSVTNGVGASSSSSDAPSTTITYIPGLPQASKTQKKRKKKSKSKVEKCNSEDSSIIFELDAESSKDDENTSEPASSPPTSQDTEQVYEIQLTDDLADSLVNPPTDPEVSEEETCDPIENDFVDEEKEIKTENSDDTTMAVTNQETTTTPSLNEELEDKEVSDITDNIDTTTDDKPMQIIPEKKEHTESLISAETVAEEIPAKTSDLINKGAKIEKKPKSKKSKKGVKLVLNSGEKDPIKEVTDTTPQDTDVLKVQHGGKMSWSSVIKSSLQPPVTKIEAQEPITASPKIGRASEYKKEKKTEKAKKVPVEEKEKVTIEKSDSWENIPASVTEQEESWEKTSKKSKKRNKVKIEEPIKEKVHDLVKEEAEQTSVKEVNNDKVLEKQKTPEAPVSETDNVLKEEEVEAESDKKKLKKRRKKQDSGEPEDLNNSHRVFICDEQLQLQYTREMRAAASRETMCPSIMEKVSVAGYCDVVYVSELGCGINRGAMNFGRLYQGKYVPPDRSDIVTEINETCDDDKNEEEDADQNDLVEDVTDVNETECGQDLSCHDADIDLD